MYIYFIYKFNILNIYLQMYVVDEKLISYLSVVTIFSLFLVDSSKVLFYNKEKSLASHNHARLILFEYFETILNF